MDPQKRTTGPKVASEPRMPPWQVSFQIVKGLDTGHVTFTVRAWNKEMAVLRASRYMSDGLQKYVDNVYVEQQISRIVTIK